MKMKKILTIAAFIFATQVQAAGYQSSPYTYNNSANSYENSSYNYKNSPHNYENSQYNYNSNNSIYDNSGNRSGYSVEKQDGGVNHFNNSGYRYGYEPAR
jgi:hypothetical protein